MNRKITWMDRTGPWDDVGHHGVLNGVQDNTQVPMSTATSNFTSSLGIAADIVVELLLENLKRRIGRFIRALKEQDDR